MITQEQAIKEIEFLIEGYTELTGHGSNKKCIPIKEACEMARSALSDWRGNTSWIFQTKTKEFKCKTCGETSFNATPYCAWCGAKSTRKKKGGKLE